MKFISKKPTLFITSLLFFFMGCVAAGTSKFEAISKTASSVTGDLEINEKTLHFALDQTYYTQRVSVVAANTPYANDGFTWMKLFEVTPSDPVEIRAVSSQKIGPHALNDSLCSKDKVTFIALARSAENTPNEILELAAFKGPLRPGEGNPEKSLCGTFSYAPAMK